MLEIKNSHFEGLRSSDLGGAITNTGENELVIECASFENICSLSGSSSCSGVIYKKSGSISMIKVLVTNCWTTVKGNNIGSSVLYCYSSTTNISHCSISYSASKKPSQVADSPLYFHTTFKTYVRQSNFSHNNGNNEWGNTYAEIRYNQEMNTEYCNLNNGSAYVVLNNRVPKEGSSIKKSNIFSMIVTYIFNSETIKFTVSECAIYGNSKGSYASIIFDKCWGDDLRIATYASTTTRVQIDKVNTNCRIIESCLSNFGHKYPYLWLSLFVISCSRNNKNKNINRGSHLYKLLN